MRLGREREREREKSRSGGSVRETRVRPGPSGGPVGGWMTVVDASDARR
jgi:hypothetical protein